jgi:predicted ATPase
MIRQFQIGNFKAFSSPQTIPLKPITIIFGPNSSGKSSVLHSLLLARHGVDTDSLDATYPSIAGQSVDLGGFRQYIHRRNLENRLQWSVEMSVATLPPNLARDLATADTLTIHLIAGMELNDEGHPVPHAVPFTQTCEYRIDGDLFMRFTRKKQGVNFRLSVLNRDHKVFDPILQAMMLTTLTSQNLKDEERELLFRLIDAIVARISFQGESNFLPGTEIDPEWEASFAQEFEAEGFSKLGELSRSVRLFLPRTLQRFHAGVCDALVESMESLTYLGPLRTFPPRHMAFAELESLGHAAGGAQAWQELAVNKPVREKVNEWLSSETRLKTPYKLKLFEYVSETELEELAVRLLEEGAIEGGQSAFDAHILGDENAEAAYSSRDHAIHGDPPYDDLGDRSVFGKEEMQEVLDTHCDFEETLQRMKDEGSLRTDWQRPSDVVLVDQRTGTEVSHRDVGIGISQVLPVLFQAYASKGKLVAMEQPEIHLHPALQAELGDVFIESALGENKNRFVLETHSEHLILRLLRRIRETSANKNDATPPITPDDIALLFVDTDGEGAHILNLRTDKRGRLLDRCPGGFFEEDFEELF